MLIDLHTHSTASDGTFTPTQVLAAARERGLDMVALTDHDTTSSWEEARRAARQHGVALMVGTEVSARADGVSVHVLSYLHDENNADFAAELAHTRNSRRERAAAMTELLAHDYPLTLDQVRAQARGESVGRPHIADALVAGGHCDSRAQAFATLLSPQSPYYVRYHSPQAHEVIALIRQAGGVAVLAHPGASARGRIVTDETIAALAAAGLAGLEVDHRDHDDAQRARLRGLAGELGLLVTGSSDFHGAGKDNQLGENLTAASVAAEIEARAQGQVVRP